MIFLAKKGGYIPGYPKKQFNETNHPFNKDSMNISYQIDSNISNGSKVNHTANFNLNLIKVFFLAHFDYINSINRNL